MTIKIIKKVCTKCKKEYPATEEYFTLKPISSRNIRKKLAEIYQNCPKGSEVDHIIPLLENKEIVRGLNVPWNLQYLTIKEHKAKHAKRP